MSIEAAPIDAAATGPLPVEGVPGRGPDAILEVHGLTRHFAVTKGAILRRRVGTVRAVDGITFAVQRGQTFGLVGESGCGKSTTARLILKLLRATSGEVVFEGRDVLPLDKGATRAMRADMQIVFQDPYASLNPRMTVRQIVAEPLVIRGVGRDDARAKVLELLQLCGLAKEHADRYPHEFSGGQRQRVGVARALALDPKLVILDEPVSALDVSIQAQIVNLLEDLQDRLGLTYVFIAHDLSVVRHISDKIAVMYLGHVVEVADRDDLYEHPRHPYTVALLSAVPIPDPRKERARERIILQGDPPSAVNPPPACRFHTRCWKAQEICRNVPPPLAEQEPGHWVACHFPEERSVL
jgi:oligopeptide/dipeptide ABC transporter ATP-binding protein